MPYLGKQNDLICFVRETVEELNAIPFVEFTSIEYSDKEWEMVDGQWVEKQEVQQDET